MSYILAIIEVANIEIMPKVIYRGKEDLNPMFDTLIHHFSVEHPNLKVPAKIDIFHHRERKDKTRTHEIDISRNVDSSDWNSDPHETLGHLSSGHLRHIMGRLRYHLPEMTHPYGERITGARAGVGMMSGSFDISRIKPIAP